MANIFSSTDSIICCSINFWAGNLSSDTTNTRKVIRSDGTIIFTGKDIRDGQNVWQSIGGHELGSIWGHGSYVAPDWSAEWLHREAVFMLNSLSINEYKQPYDSLTPEKQAYIKVILQKDLRKNTYNANDKSIVISDIRSKAIANNCEYYEKLFTDDPAFDRLREQYAIKTNTIT